LLPPNSHPTMTGLDSPRRGLRRGRVTSSGFARSVYLKLQPDWSARRIICMNLAIARHCCARRRWLPSPFDRGTVSERGPDSDGTPGAGAQAPRRALQDRGPARGPQAPAQRAKRDLVQQAPAPGQRGEHRFGLEPASASWSDRASNTATGHPDTTRTPGVPRAGREPRPGVLRWSVRVPPALVT